MAPRLFANSGFIKDLDDLKVDSIKISDSLKFQNKDFTTFFESVDPSTSTFTSTFSESAIKGDPGTKGDRGNTGERGKSIELNSVVLWTGHTENRARLVTNNELSNSSKFVYDIYIDLDLQSQLDAITQNQSEDQGQINTNKSDIVLNTSNIRLLNTRLTNLEDPPLSLEPTKTFDFRPDQELHYNYPFLIMPDFEITRTKGSSYDLIHYNTKGVLLKDYLLLPSFKIGGNFSVEIVVRFPPNAGNPYLFYLKNSIVEMYLKRVGLTNDNYNLYFHTATRNPDGGASMAVQQQYIKSFTNTNLNNKILDIYVNEDIHIVVTHKNEKQGNPTKSIYVNRVSVTDSTTENVYTGVPGSDEPFIVLPAYYEFNDLAPFYSGFPDSSFLGGQTGDNIYVSYMKYYDRDLTSAEVNTLYTNFASSLSV